MSVPIENGRQHVIIHAEEISKSFRRTSALENVSLDLLDQTSVALVGANGAGKTSFMKIICGLSKPSSGHISVLNQVPDLTSSEFVSSVAYLDQRHPLYEFLTVDETIRFGVECNPNWQVDEANAGVELFQLPRGNKVHELSGGQRAQLALILAICKGSQAVLLDEPMASLDPLSRKLAQDLVNRSKSRTSLMVISSHIIGELQEMCNFLILFSKGRVRLSGNFIDLISQWQRGYVETSDARRVANSGDFSNNLEGLVNAILLDERYGSTFGDSGIGGPQ
jgi:ABC-2 type transport system ATP-binding protein